MGCKVGDVMTSEVVCARLSTRYKELVRLLAGRHISAVPVVDDVRHVLGVVSESDLILKQGRPVERRRARGGTAAELMSWPVVTVGPQASVVEAARLLRKHHVKRLPVVDPTGRLIGIVSHSDVLEASLRSDEEIRQP